MKKANEINKALVRDFKSKVKYHTQEIAKHRDELRKLYESAENIVGVSEDAIESLQYAIDKLSEEL